MRIQNQGKIMKRYLLAMVISVGTAISVSATVYTFDSPTLNYNLPDDGNLYSFDLGVSHPDSSITDVAIPPPPPPP